ncbi:TonB-dependent receptor [Sphingomonas sp.]|uniref:TonB-dependent receptor n=1 Tax=Sphingomonas sp. TaxID=28214 RepID=UPI002C230255|nr:TonB-dependent receptor [Sphingomonas sp.]HWK36827.1 TonB-dependent receptor [Sphingomonas sp.]
MANFARIRIVRGALSTAAIAALCSAVPAMAQSAESAAPAVQDGPQLDDIVVSSRKIEEKLQDVPIAVTAFSGNQLREGQITDLTAIAGRTPSFTLQAQGSLEQEAFIRGVGTVRLSSATADPSIGLFINEVYVGRRGAATPPIFDLERLEVLRGPQGTIFGKNVVGGAVSLVTGVPRFTREAAGYVSVGNYGTIQSEAHITGPISENVAVRVAVQQNRHDGYSYNVVNGQELDDFEGYAGRVSVLAKAGERLTLNFIADASHDEGGGQARHAVDDPTRAGVGPITTGQISKDPRATETPYLQYNRRNTYGFTARADYELDFATLTYLGAVRIGDSGQRFSQAGAGAPPSYTDSVLTQSEKYTGITQEVRLRSNGTGPFRWVAGLYYLREETDRSSQNTARSALPGGPGSTRDSLDGDNVFAQNGVASNYAAFGELSYEIIPGLTASAGARYTIDHKVMDGYAKVLSLGPAGDLLSPAPLQGPYDVNVKKTWRETTPRFALDWKLTPDILLYASMAKGFKGGGWQAATPDAATARLAFDPETAWNYEIGFKSDLFDRRVRLNLAAFQLDFKDLQVERLDDVLLTTVVANAANAKIKGIEGELSVAVTRQLTLSASGSVLDAKYKDYVDPARNIIYSGNKLARTPDYQYSLSGDFVQPVINDDYAIKLHADYTYQDNFFYGPDNTNFEPGYGLLDARVSFGKREGNWEVALWAKNLTNKLYRTSVIPFLGDEASLYGAPRTYGLRLSGKF